MLAETPEREKFSRIPSRIFTERRKRQPMITVDGECSDFLSADSRNVHPYVMSRDRLRSGRPGSDSARDSRSARISSSCATRVRYRLVRC
jgi:hypothetical protein